MRYNKHKNKFLNTNIYEFWNQSFDNKSVIIREQSAINKEHHRNGARPEKGQYFDIRAIVFNLKKINKMNILQGIEAVKKEYGENLFDQALLNCLYKDDCKYDNNISNNIRFSIISEIEKTKKEISIIEKSIISFEKRDVFGCGKVIMPWEVALDEKEFDSVCIKSAKIRPYDKRKSRELFIEVYKIWACYAKIVYTKHPEVKALFDNVSIKNVIDDTQINRFIELGDNVFSKITNGERIDDEILKMITY